MFTCTACLQRALYALSLPRNISNTTRPSTRNYSIVHSRSLLPRSENCILPVPQLYKPPGRFHSTVQSIRKGHHRRRLLGHLDNKHEQLPPNSRRNPAKPNPVELRDKLSRENNRKLLDQDPVGAQLRRKAEYEAQFVVADPVKLATAVADKLREGPGTPRDRGDIEAALELVRASEKARQTARGKDGEMIQLEKKGTVDNVVSWNHIIDWLMEKGDSIQAQKVYNEMKKRGHRPDAHTYTIMLRGFGKNVKKPNAVKDAVNVYNSIFAPNSAVKPNTIHTNAVINTCARGGDLDSLWAVTGRLPERGPSAPDKWTFTTILNAIQHDATKRAAHVAGKYGKEEADTNLIFEEAINDGRKLWRDIVTRWRKGDLMIDEPLTCAMGRLLLLSNKRRDVLDVFELVHQTMNIKMLTQIPSESISEEPVNESLSLDTTQDTGSVESTEADAETSLIPTFSPSTSQLGITKALAYAIPGNNALSMLIEASTVIRQLHTGKAYWEILTAVEGPYHVAPDAQNIIAYLRLLRISRSSKSTLELLQQDWPSEVAKRLYTRGTFTIAMSTCVRDKNNPNVFHTASRILDLMQDKASVLEDDVDELDDISDEDDVSINNNIVDPKGQTLDLEPKVLTMYLGLAVVTTKGLGPGLPLTRKQDGDFDFERDLKKNNVARALKRLGPDMINIKRLLRMKVAQTQYDDVPLAVRTARRKKKDFVDVDRVGERFDDLVGLVRGLVGAYDKIIAVNEKLENEGMGPLDSNFIEDCWSQKRKLSAFLSKMVTKKDQEQLSWQGKRSGLWEGYEPGSARNRSNIDSSREADAEISNESEMIDSAEHLGRTPASAKLNQLIKMEAKTQKRQQESLHLSRRQQREVEKERRFGRGNQSSSNTFQSSRYQQPSGKTSPKPMMARGPVRGTGRSRNDDQSQDLFEEYRARTENARTARLGA